MHFLQNTFSLCLPPTGWAISIALLLGNGQAWAQGPGEVQNTRIEIIKEKQIRLQPAAKRYDPVPPLSPQTNEGTMVYELKDVKLDLPLSDVEINPFLEKQSLVKDLWEAKPLKILLKGAYGNYATSLAEVQAQYALNEKQRFGAYFQHRASGRGEVADDFSGLSRNVLGLYGAFFLENSAILTQFEYRRQVNRFYGYEPRLIETLDRDTLRQRFDRFRLAAQYRGIDAEAAFQYEAELKITALADAFAASEAQIGLEGRLAYRVSEAGQLVMPLEAYLMQRKDGLTQNRPYLQAAPAFRYQGDRFGLLAGVRLAYENEEVAGQNNFHLYPQFRGEYQLNEALQLFAALDGGLQRVSLDGLIAQNPFLAPQVALLHTNQRWEAALGLQGTLSGKLRYQLKGSYGQYENLGFFLNQSLDTARFVLAYETNAANILQVGGQLGYEFSEKYQLKLGLDFFNYDLPTLEAPFHRPTFTAQVTATARPIEDLRLQLYAQVLGGLQAFEPISGLRRSLDTIADVSFEAEYLIFKNFSAFLLANNLLARAYSRYLYYPGQGFNFLIGLTYAF
ncbi:MAG: hypothetical protein HC913_07380 [Microscillaceae bacterium]|nr:hypothetical protein [Microscillaceae bacterium]